LGADVKLYPDQQLWNEKAEEEGRRLGDELYAQRQLERASMETQ
jgi:hypothetical protein